MSNYTQDNRRMTLETPLGKDTLLLRSFSGHEQMSALFSFDLDLLSENDSIKPADIVNKPVTLMVQHSDNTPRYYHGIINRFSYSGRGDRLSVYRATMVPWLWFLTRGSDCRVFQEKSVPDIIKKVFADVGFTDYEMKLQGSYQPWDYCVQYRESNLNFVSRLMEHEGIFYYFAHDKKKHTLIIGDRKTAFQDAKDNQVEFNANLAEGEVFDQITQWEHRYEFRSGKFTHTDYNFETPSTSLLAKVNGNLPVDGSKFEFYDFPGEFENRGQADAEAKLRLEEEEVAFDTVTGESNCRSFSPGLKFTIKKHHAKGEKDKAYVLTAVRHVGSVGHSLVSGGSEDQDGYSNTFVCVPEAVTYRPPRLTPQPRIHGMQTAVVAGPSGEEIYTDKYGRIKIQFHWDRVGTKNENSSCWVRVMQPWTGKNWGMISIPRIGSEVVVQFLEGDPDRPLVMGMVYNADYMPPYGLPDNKTQTGVKTHSSKQGGSSNFNELRFEDKKGSEEVYMQAEKDFTRKVKNNDTLTVTQDKKSTIEKGDRSCEISMGNDSLMIKMGNQTTKLDLGKSETEAMQSIELKVGQSSIKLDQMGVTIKGMMISVEGQIQTEVKGLMTQVTGSALLQLQGGITMIG